MLCKNPYSVAHGALVGCGQCHPCRFNRRRLWTYRQVLESFMHKENCFITLTYADEFLPVDGSVSPNHLRLWLYRFRKALRKENIFLRYVAVGEYGEQTKRPHYHLSAFGVGQWCQEIVLRTWAQGHVMAAEFNPATASYVSGYVVKKMTYKGADGLDGRHPEFARFSNRPGIGATAIQVIAGAMSSEAGLAEMERTGDVPPALKMGGKSIPLGRYLRQKLRDELHFSEEDKLAVKQAWLDEKFVEMLRLQKDYEDHKALVTHKQRWLKKKEGALINFEGRSKLYDQKKELL